MAKGNNGNLLQHTVEAEIVRRLCPLETSSLDFRCTHGMAPFEAFTPRGKQPSAYRLLEFWLERAATSDDLQILPAVLTAYKLCRASPLYYPNSVEIVDALTPALTGKIAEADGAKYARLAVRWEKRQVSIHHHSWRHNNAEILAPRHRPAQPWLLSLDPMSFTEAGVDDDDQLHPSDLDLIATRWTEFVQTEQSGAMSVFCYSMQPSVAAAYRNAIEQRRFPNQCFIETVVRGGNRHIAAICSTDSKIVEQAQVAWTQIADASAEL